MREGGRLDAQCFKGQQMLEGVAEVILTANDVGDAEIGVVGAGGQVVCGVAVGAQQGEVFNLVGLFGLLTINGVGEGQGAVLAARDAKAEARRSESSRESSGIPGLKSQAP